MQLNFTVSGEYEDSVSTVAERCMIIGEWVDVNLLLKHIHTIISEK